MFAVVKEIKCDGSRPLGLCCRCVNVMTLWVGCLDDTQNYTHAFTNRTGQIVCSCSLIVALYDEEWQ